MTAGDVGHGRKCLCGECTAGRLAIEASTRRVVERPSNPFAPQHDHVMTLSVATAATPRRKANQSA